MCYYKLPIIHLFFPLFFLHTISTTAQSQVLHKWAWYPATEKTVFYQKGEWYGFTKPQQQKMYANMAKIVELLHQTPCVNPPQGFEVGIYATICENGCAREKIMSGSSGIIFREYFMRNNSATIERDAEGPAIRIYFNDITRLLSKLPAGAEAYYEEMEVIDSLQDFPVYAGGGFVVITKRKKPLFTPVTKEDVLQIEISNQEKSLEKTKETFRKSNLEWETVLRNMPAKDSALKKELIKNIADQKPYITKAEADLTEVKKKLAGLSPSERKSPALNYYQEKRLVVPNKDFFDPALPAHAIQLVVIDFNESTLNTREGSYANLFREIRKTIDLKKILAALE